MWIFYLWALIRSDPSQHTILTCFYKPPGVIMYRYVMPILYLVVKLTQSSTARLLIQTHQTDSALLRQKIRTPKPSIAIMSAKDGPMHQADPSHWDDLRPPTTAHCTPSGQWRPVGWAGQSPPPHCPYLQWPHQHNHHPLSHIHQDETTQDGNPRPVWWDLLGSQMLQCPVPSLHGSMQQWIPRWPHMDCLHPIPHERWHCITLGHAGDQNPLTWVQFEHDLYATFREVNPGAAAWEKRKSLLMGASTAEGYIQQFETCYRCWTY